MKFTSSISAALVAATSFASISLAAPLSSGAALSKRDGWDSWNTSAPATTTPPAAPLATYFPDTIAVWNIGLGKIDQWQPSQPIVRGHGTTNGQDLSVLATFNIPSTWAGKQCELVFDLESWNPSSYAAGTMIGDMFSSLKPATREATGNNRNQPIGQFLAKKGERAATPSGRILFPCSTAAYSVEMAPHGQSASTYIGWSSWVDGLKVIVQ